MPGPRRDVGRGNEVVPEALVQADPRGRPRAGPAREGAACPPPGPGAGRTVTTPAPAARAARTRAVPASRYGASTTRRPASEATDRRGAGVGHRGPAAWHDQNPGTDPGGTPRKEGRARADARFSPLADRGRHEDLVPLLRRTPRQFGPSSGAENESPFLFRWPRNQRLHRLGIVFAPRISRPLRREAC